MISTGATGAAISVSGVTKRFDGITAVDNVSLTIHPGEVIALLGHNGAGKTTLLDMILGFTTPDSGSITVLGGVPAETAHSGRIGAMLQSGGLLKDLSVRDTLAFVAKCHVDHLPIPQVIERAGLSDFADRKVGKCSGGQVQRLRFALALLSDPDILILDEPTAGLDAAARRDFWETMRGEAQRGHTVIFATHYLQEADDFADRLVLIRSGRIVLDGATTDLLSSSTRHLTGTWCSTTSPIEVAAGLGLPPTAVTYSAGRDGTTSTTTIDTVDNTDAATADSHATSPDPHDQLVTFTCADTDALALELLRRGCIRDITIATSSVEDLFFEYGIGDTPADSSGATADTAVTVDSGKESAQ